MHVKKGQDIKQPTGVREQKSGGSRAPPARGDAIVHKRCRSLRGDGMCDVAGDGECYAGVRETAEIVRGIGEKPILRETMRVAGTLSVYLCAPAPPKPEDKWR